MKYCDAGPIRTRACSAWIVTFDDNSSALELWAPETTVQDVIRSVLVHNPGSKFRVQNMTVGCVKVREVTSAYFSDGRSVSSDMDVLL